MLGIIVIVLLVALLIGAIRRFMWGGWGSGWGWGGPGMWGGGWGGPGMWGGGWRRGPRDDMRGPGGPGDRGPGGRDGGRDGGGRAGGGPGGPR
ncbi:MAG: hypothetical protein ACOYJL_04150 [Tractidigestivibacter sp.]|uniref:hypothetical protein n=1 Tax=Tractidigestivibacter sp. TaxID=2847320 RepID=UPI003D936B8A